MFLSFLFIINYKYILQERGGLRGPILQSSNNNAHRCYEFQYVKATSWPEVSSPQKLLAFSMSYLLCSPLSVMLFSESCRSDSEGQLLMEDPTQTYSAIPLSTPSLILMSIFFCLSGHAT